MLTLKVITENPDEVVRKLARKQFDAKEPIAKVLELDKVRRASQVSLDSLLAEINSLSRSVGQLMKEGKKEEAEGVKAKVASLKDQTKDLQEEMDRSQEEITAILCTIPNIPYDDVPDGKCAEDNVVVKTGNEIENLNEDALPHWELAKKI
jgi:seryl-tRNA synthetase